MAATIYILNGPNLNMLGKREPEIYGSETLEDIERRCRKKASSLGLDIELKQTNIEGELVGWIQAARDNAAGIIINAAAYTHTSVAVHDALKGCGLPVIEVHITNIHRREAPYKDSLTSLASTGVICGLGPIGYELALHAIAQRLREAATA